VAGTDGDNTTDDDWRLASVELAFVAEYTRSEKAAKELLFDYLDDGSIRWRCWQLAIDDGAGPSANPPLVTSIAAASRFFWRRNSSLCTCSFVGSERCRATGDALCGHYSKHSTRGTSSYPHPARGAVDRLRR